MTQPSQAGRLQTAHPPQANKWVIFATVAIGVFMATIDGSIVNLALPVIGTAFNASLGAIEWVALAYLLTVTALLLALGRLADMIGRRGLYILGFILFTIGSVFCGMAHSLIMLIAARVVQAIGAAMLFAIGPAVLVDAFPSSERGRALGYQGAIVAAGTSTGPTVGGLLLSVFGWPSIFLINLPIGIIAIAMAWRFLPRTAGTGRERFDIPGALLFLISITSFLLALSQGQEIGWANPLILGFFAIAVIMLPAFVIWEARQGLNAMLNLALFRNRVFAASLVAGFLSFLATSCNFFIMPFYLQQVLDEPTWRAGLILISSSVILSMAAPLGGNLADRFPIRWVASGGLAITCLAMVLIAGMQATWTPLDVMWRLGLIGLGGGLFQSPNSSAIMGSVPSNQRGIASGLLAFMRNLGIVSGTALAAAFWATARAIYATQANVPEMSAAAQIAGMRTAYLIMAGVVALGVLLSLLRGKVGTHATGLPPASGNAPALNPEPRLKIEG